MYKQYLIHLTPFQIRSFKVLCQYNEKLQLGYTFKLNYANLKNKKIFVVFLTKSQINDLNKAKKNKEKYDLQLSYNQLGETCPDIIEINNKIEDIKKKKKTTKDKNKLMREKLANLRLKNQKKRDKVFET